jgi:hypothetical protein
MIQAAAEIESLIKEIRELPQSKGEMPPDYDPRLLGD